MLNETDIAVRLSMECGAYIFSNALERFATGRMINEDISTKPKTVFALSATPEQAFGRWKDLIYSIRLKCQVRAYETLKTLYYNDLLSTLWGLDENEKTLLYVPKISTMEKAMDII